MVCKACGRVDHFDFHVPDDIWNAIVPPPLRNRVVCLNCFDRYAKEMGVDYADYIKDLYFAGDRACYIFHTVSSTNVTRV